MRFLKGLFYTLGDLLEEVLDAAREGIQAARGFLPILGFLIGVALLCAAVLSLQGPVRVLLPGMSRMMMTAAGRAAATDRATAAARSWSKRMGYEAESVVCEGRPHDSAAIQCTIRLDNDGVFFLWCSQAGCEHSAN